jgi:protein O-GlcNAc transferase
MPMSEESLNTAFRLHRAGDLAGAAGLYGEVLRADPANAQALYLLGFVHFQRGEFSNAEKRMGEALKLNPVSLDALYNRGSALMKLNRHVEALASFDLLLQINPTIAEAWAARGKALLDMHRYGEGLASFDKALRFGNDQVGTWTNRGIALAAEGRALEALASYDRALAIELHTATLNNRANVLCDLKRFEEAQATYETILSLDPQFRYARGNLVFCRLQCCDWRSLHEERERISTDLRAGIAAAQPGALLALSFLLEDQLRCAQLWAANTTPPMVDPLWRGERYRHDRIRVAYLSGDFHSQAVAYLMAGVFECHDKERFEISAMSFGPDDGSEMRGRLLGAFENFIDVRGKSDAEAAAALRSMEIDIAVDLKGDTGGSRSGILSRRPAPVQAQYLGTRYHGRRVHRLHFGRPRCDSRGATDTLHRESGVSA